METSRVAYAHDYFVELGYDPIHAAAIVGNLVHESGGPHLPTNTEGDPDDNGNPTAFGIAQWRKERFDDPNGVDGLKQFAERLGEDWRDLDTQLAFVAWELNNTEATARRELLATTDYREATEVFAEEYERPARDGDGNVLGDRERKEWAGWALMPPPKGRGWRPGELTPRTPTPPDHRLRSPEPFDADLTHPAPGRAIHRPSQTPGAFDADLTPPTPGRELTNSARSNVTPGRRGFRNGSYTGAATDIAGLRRRKKDIEGKMTSDLYWGDNGMQEEYRQVVTALDEHDRRQRKAARQARRAIG